MLLYLNQYNNFFPGNFVCRSCYSSREHSSPRLVQRSIRSGAGFYFPKQRLSTHGNRLTHAVLLGSCCNIFECSSKHSCHCVPVDRWMRQGAFSPTFVTWSQAGLCASSLRMSTRGGLFLTGRPAVRWLVWLTKRRYIITLKKLSLSHLNSRVAQYFKGIILKVNFPDCL